MVSTFRNRIKLAVTILVLFLGVPGTQHSILHDALAETQNNAAKIAAKDLESAIAERAKRVEEFRFIRQEAEKLGVRAWLFGGTAAGFGHYVNWDLKREGGDKRFQPDRFDYDYTNIYRSTQDLDIVIDGTPEQAQKLQAELARRYPHLQGSKSAWEVRLLRASLGEKEALLDNPDYLNQHTDSNSTGMIEITKPAQGDPVVRDLRDWKSKEPHFLKDVSEGKLHYYFSPKHGKTARAAKGLNPPILSAIRYLTKAFQYDLELRPEDLAKIKRVIQEFDPKRDLSDHYVSTWIEKNGKKLIQHAVNIEYAWQTLEKLGLRKKLIEIQGNAVQQDSLAWWLSREPLRTQPLGRGRGKTAKALGIDTVAHETSDFFAYESITRAHTGDPNVLISRNMTAGEVAAYGDGFYTRIGRTGARGTGFTIRFQVDPKARQGSDFEIYGSDYVVVKNRSALRVIPESLSMTPLEYFRYLAKGEQLSKDDRGLLEKIRRRVISKVSALTGEESKLIYQVVKAHPAPSVLQEWFTFPVSAKFPESAKLIEPYIERGNPEELKWLLKEVFPNLHSPRLLQSLMNKTAEMKGWHGDPLIGEVFSSPLWADEPQLLKQLIDRAPDRDIPELLVQPFREAQWGKYPDLMRHLLETIQGIPEKKRGLIYKVLISTLVMQHWQKYPEFIESIRNIQGADNTTARALLRHAPDWHPDWLDEIFLRGNANEAFIDAASPQYWKQNPEKWTAILEKGDADQMIALRILADPRRKDPELLKLLIRRGRADEVLLRHVLPEPFWGDHLDLLVPMIQRGAKSNFDLFINLFEDDVMAERTDLLKLFYREIDDDPNRVKHVLMIHWRISPELIDFILDRKTADQEIAQQILTKPPWRDHPKWEGWIDQLVARGKVDSSVLGLFVVNSRARHLKWFAAYIDAMVREGKNVEDGVAQLLLLPHWENNSELKKLVGKTPLNARNLISAIQAKLLSMGPTSCPEVFGALK